ncbi:MAG: hypothetical protein WC757_03065 [Candidatus Paceibacterota bacterium]|jgi:hypothetical protein
MNSSTTPPVPEFLKALIQQIIQAFGDATVRTYHMAWGILITFLTQNLMWVISILVCVLVFSFVDYLITGLWKNLGSVLYTYTYYGILFIIGLIFGPEVFAKDWIDLILFIIYVISFIWVRTVLNRTGIRKTR